MCLPPLGKTDGVRSAKVHEREDGSVSQRKFEGSFPKLGVRILGRRWGKWPLMTSPQRYHPSYLVHLKGQRGSWCSIAVLGEYFSSREILTFSLSDRFSKSEAVAKDSLSFQMENLIGHELLVISLRSKNSLWAF